MILITVCIICNTFLCSFTDTVPSWMFAQILNMTSHGFKSSKQDFAFGPWKVTATKTHIMKSKDIEQ